MTAKHKIYVEKVELILKEFHKNFPGITEGSAVGAGVYNNNLLAPMSEERTWLSNTKEF
ncbi:hypothetical protein L580_1939 [Serratia fonticola AU-P3(3)]|nr:hypothetical protein L580_1939 [Serratia fonticola AU-P3(3)]